VSRKQGPTSAKEPKSVRHLSPGCTDVPPESVKVWNKEVFGDVNLASKEIQKRLDELDFRDDEVELVESERD